VERFAGIQMMRAALVLGLVGACGGGEGEGQRLPRIEDLGGPRMAHPQLVMISYAGDPLGAALMGYGRWLVTSRWLEEVGAEYGVGAGSVLATMERSDSAPMRIDDTAIVEQLFADIDGGVLPAPPGAGPGEVLYVVHVPSPTVVTSFGGRSCVDFGGYHASARRDGRELVYVVVPACPGFVSGLDELHEREYVMSHVAINAATDPIPDHHPAFRLRDPSGSWSGLGEEVADLCTRADETGLVRDGDFVAARSWSNAAAAAGGDPCLPVTGDGLYVNVKRDGNVQPRIPPGGRGTVGVTGWSNRATADWTLSLIAGRPNDVMATPQAATLGDGESTKIDMTISAAATPGTTLPIFVYSTVSESVYQILPMTVIVGEPCSAFTSCEDCSGRVGCGFCQSSGRCVAQGVEGSADGECSAESLAIWPGTCPGYCAQGSGSCGECASLAGCGWCAAGGGQCLEADANFAGPAEQSCAYADWSFTTDYCPR
jgi:hypothetical protein